MSEQPVFNRSVLAELSTELGCDGVRELLKIFLADTSLKMDALAVEAPGRLLVKRDAHSIKSSAATFGFERLAMRSLALEAGAEDMDDAELTASIGALRRTFMETSKFASSELLDIREGCLQ